MEQIEPTEKNKAPPSENFQQLGTNEIEKIQPPQTKTFKIEDISSIETPDEVTPIIQPLNILQNNEIERIQRNDPVAKNQSPKRKKVVLNFVQKFEILDKLKAGVKVTDIANEYNIGVSTVCDLRRNGDQKLLKYRKDNILNMTRKSTKNSEFPLLDKVRLFFLY